VRELTAVTAYVAQSVAESDARRLAALQVFLVGVLPFLGDAKLTEFLRYAPIVTVGHPAAS
jgi:hypothetical protein